jgi:hypothetical protein
MNEQAFPIAEGVRTRVIDENTGEEVTENPLASSPDVDSGDAEESESIQPKNSPFKILNEDELTLDNMFMNGVLVGHIQLTETISAKYKTLSAEETQAIEGSIDVDDGKSGRYVLGEISIGQLTASLVAVGDTVLPDDPKDKGEIIRKWPSMYVNLLIDGYSYFALICKGLISKDGIQNF